MINEYSLVTLTEVKSFAGIIGSVANTDTLLENLINSVSTLFETYMDRKILSREYTEEKDGNGVVVLFPKQYPITTISGIWDDNTWAWANDTLIDSDKYKIVDSSYVIFKDTMLGNYSQNVRITYLAGYVTVPEDLKQACIAEVVRIYKNKNNISVVTRFSKTVADGSTAFASDDLLPQTRLTLDKYKRISIT